MSCNFLKCVYFCISVHFGEERSERECVWYLSCIPLSLLLHSLLCVCVCEREWERLHGCVFVSVKIMTRRHSCYHCNCQLCEAELLWKWKVLFLIFKTVRSVQFRGMENKLQKPLKSLCSQLIPTFSVWKIDQSSSKYILWPKLIKFTVFSLN